MKFSLIKNILSDFSGYLYLSKDFLQQKMSFYLSTFFIKIDMCLRGIKYGKEISFWGLTHFRRYPKSKINIGDNCSFRSSFLSNYIGLNRKCLISTHSHDAEIIISNNVGMSGTVIGAYNLIKIGENVIIGGNTLITDFDWHKYSINEANQLCFYISQDKQSNGDYSKEVIIGNNIWIGANCTILKGVKIGDNVIIGANSLVTKSIPSNVVAGGNPCKIIRKLIS